jgi:hypothetical protein
MYFITGLPKLHGKDCRYVVVGWVTKFAHFVVISSEYEALQVAKVFFRQVFRLHGFPTYIVSDRDNRFFGTFWQEPSRLAVTELTPSTLFPPNGCIQKQEPKTWLIWIPIVISVAQRESVGIGDGGLLRSHLICRSLQCLILVGKFVIVIGLLLF